MLSLQGGQNAVYEDYTKGAFDNNIIHKSADEINKDIINLMSDDEITAKINESGKKTVFLGDGVPVFADYLKENLQVPYLFAPAHCNKQRAACVAVLGGILYRQGKAEDAAAHKPDYLRLSQAERERQEKARDFRI